MFRRRSPLTVAGAVTELRSALTSHRVPYYPVAYQPDQSVLTDSRSFTFCKWEVGRTAETARSYPNSSVATPNRVWGCAGVGAGPRYIRAVANPETNPKPANAAVNPV